MAISSNINVTSDIEGYTLAELLDLLGSSSKVKSALSDIEKAARKNTTALKALNKAEADRQASVLSDNAKREKEITAISADRDALKAAWAKLDADSTSREASIHTARQALKKEKGAAASQEADVARSLKSVADARTALELDRKHLDAQVAEALEEANQIKESADNDREAAKRMLAEANAKVAEMRKLVA
jgi:DNA repair exonuclease SbcCD ATPase subunit